MLMQEMLSQFAVNYWEIPKSVIGRIGTDLFQVTDTIYFFT